MDSLRLGTDKGEGVGFGQRADEPRTLSPDGPGEPAFIRAREAHPHRVHPAEVVLHVFFEIDLYVGPSVVLAAHHLHEGWPDEEFEADHRRNRVAGETEEADVVPNPEEERFAGLELDPRENLLHAELEHRALDEVLFPHRDPAARHHHISTLKGLSHSVAYDAGFVGGGAYAAGFGPDLMSLRDHGEGIGVVDLAGRKIPRPRLDQLRARGEDDHLRAPMNRKLSISLPRPQGYFGGPDLRPLFQDNGPFAHVLAAAADLLARRPGLLELELLAPAAGVLDHHDRIGAFGDDPAGEDLYGLAFPDAPRGRTARWSLVHH